MDKAEQEQVVVTIQEPVVKRESLDAANSDFVRAVPYASSCWRMALYVVLCLCTGGLLLVFSTCFPQWFTRIARTRLSGQSSSRADYVLLLVVHRGIRSRWLTMKVSRSKLRGDKHDRVAFEINKTVYVLNHNNATFEEDSGGIYEPVGKGDRLVYADKEYVRVVPYAFSYVRYMLFISLCVCSGGFVLVISVWFPQVFTRLARLRLPSACLGRAEYLLVLVEGEGLRAKWVEVKVMRTKGVDNKPDRVVFEFKKNRYEYNYDTADFDRYLSRLHEDLDKIKERAKTGLTGKVVDARMKLYSPNLIDLDPTSVLMLLFTKLVHPYYLFQVFGAVVWLVEEYTIYAITILVLSAISMAGEIFTEVTNRNRLRALVRSNQHIKVVCNGSTDPTAPESFDTIHETDLVPGDIVIVETGNVCADMLVISGDCVVDESNLTGEAIPINKRAATAAGEVSDSVARTTFTESMLHAGSTVTRLRQGEVCKGVVLSTGFSTGKGDSFRSIIFPKEIKFEYERDSYRYLLVLVAIALGAIVKRIVDDLNSGTPVTDIIMKSLDLITITVPPSLPLVLSVGTNFALTKLFKKGISCIDARRINCAGQLTCYCFDKTGTLTEESLKLHGVDPIKQSGTPSFQGVEETISKLPFNFLLGLATCHGLSEIDGNLEGYSLELDMFKSTGFKMRTLHDKELGNYVALVTSPDGKQYGVVKRFAFDATCQRSSVIVESLETKQRFVFVKGAPEAVAKVSSAATLPTNFQTTTLVYSSRGYYCIGFGTRETTDLSDDPVREAVEVDVDYMGISLFINEVKPESGQLLEDLYAANMDVRIITGDSALTAVHVSRVLKLQLQQNMAVVDVIGDDVMFHPVKAIMNGDASQWQHLSASNISRVYSNFDCAMTGAALEMIAKDSSKDSLMMCIRRTKIFARVRSQQKAWIVEQLMDMGHIVGMCGDGTNDCGALKAAHVGLALSSGDASIVAPFTSKAKDVTNVLELIREGRCALTTSFLGFKFMVLFPIIQLAMVITLGHYDIMLSNNQYIWDDMAIVLGLSITMLHTDASEALTKQRPPRTLFSVSIVASILGQISIFIAFFAGAFALLHSEHWFCSAAQGASLLDNNSHVDACEIYNNYNTHKNAYSYENTQVWLFSHLLYISVAAAFNVKDPFRKWFYTNRLFTTLIIAVTAVNIWFLFDNKTLHETFNIMPIPTAFRGELLGMFIGHTVVSIGWETLLPRLLDRFGGERDHPLTGKMK